jgi:hypothetical protein
MSARKPTGCVIYAGPSLLDGKPIVAVAVTAKSANSKTGGMVQTYIIRSDVDPRDASRTGEDYSICGTCPHRGVAQPDKATGLAAKRTCYVVIGQGPVIVFKGLQRGIYPAARGHKAIAALGNGRMVRLGTYGDPAAVPAYVWESLTSEAKGHTAYSHQATTQGADYRPSMFMRSADSELEARTAWAIGERTFRVIGAVADVVKGSEILCPASEEAGRKTTCDRCGLCGGASVAAKSIAIVVHGAGKSHYA